MTRPQRDQYEQTVARMMNDAPNGVFIQAVMGTETEPGFHYTVGLSDVGEPEFIIYGLPYAIGGHILNDLANRVRAGERFTDQQILTDLFQGGFEALLVKAVDLSPITMARSFFMEPSLLLVLFGDAENRFIWQDSEDPVINATPLLGCTITDDTKVKLRR